MKLATRIGLGVASLALLAGCSSLPNSGPHDDAIRTQASLTIGEKHPVSYGYALVDLSDTVLQAIGGERGNDTFKSFGGGRGGAPTITLGVGDVIQITVYESQPGGLFIPAEAGSRPGNYVTFPSQTIGKNGYITVPYAGSVRAVGRSQSDIEADIVSRLVDRAIEPQVTLSVVEQKAANASVVGSVNTPNAFAVSQGGDTILDMIARAGGIRGEPYETYVTLQRRGKSATVAFNKLIATPSENIYTAPGDTIYVYGEQKIFMGFGASGQVGRFPFGRENLNLAEAVGLAGGLLDNRADPGAVFIYRMEEMSVLERLGIDVSRFARSEEKFSTAKVPTIYQANFRKPEIFFLAQRFFMEPDDILYVSNADSVEVSKALGVLGTVTAPVISVANFTN
ncbi:polysaccharide biosynthesis/export family protein [Jiella pacifica]|uniref:Polysaccharide export protein n=1 Tax=Jiella pacifica TaxID=2696469 RepID=A0A6N9SZV6_9HYPH|nr:polysaccharide biosynthesis/export family protein [Jiella pacifica]NDW04361.1 polysaccharide export protein [Jiella pacifica]